MKPTNFAERQAARDAFHATQRPRPPLASSGLNLPSTLKRRYHGQDHMTPQRGMWDADGRVWHGHSRVTNKPARRRANRASWAKILRIARREYMEEKRALAVIAAAEVKATKPKRKGRAR